jgi:adenylate cyclase
MQKRRDGRSLHGRSDRWLFRSAYAPAHARIAIDAGLELLRATGNVGVQRPWVPTGVGVHTGEAYIGTVGRAGGLLELTAIGEDVNVAARLASIAQAGEIVCSEDTYAAAAASYPAERREVALKGVSAPISVRVIRAN